MIALLLSGCRDPVPPLRVACNEWPGYEPLRMAEAAGYLGTRQVRILTFPSVSDVIRSYRNGTVDVAAVTGDEALRVFERSPEHRVFLVCDVSKGADSLVARPEYPSVLALKGRRIGVQPDAVGAYLLARALELSGMSAGEVTIVPLDVDEHEAAYVAGRVDAVVTMDPVRAKLLDTGARSLFDSSQIPGEIVDVLMTRPEVIEGRRAELDLLVGGWFRARTELTARRPADLSRLARRSQVTPGSMVRSLDDLEFPDLGANARLLGSSTNSLAEAWRRLARMLTQQGLTGPLADPATLLDDTLVNAPSR